MKLTSVFNIKGTCTQGVLALAVRLFGLDLCWVASVNPRDWVMLDLRVLGGLRKLFLFQLWFLCFVVARDNDLYGPPNA